MLSPGLVSLKRQYPKGSDLENQAFTFRELPTPSSASPHHQHLCQCSPLKDQGFLRYWMWGQGTHLASKPQSGRYRFLLHTNNYCSINTPQSLQQKQRRGSRGESLVGERHPTVINSSPDQGSGHLHQQIMPYPEPLLTSSLMLCVIKYSKNPSMFALFPRDFQ